MLCAVYGLCAVYVRCTRAVCGQLVAGHTGWAPRDPRGQEGVNPGQRKAVRRSPSGLVDGALASWARDCGFESHLGWIFSPLSFRFFFSIADSVPRCSDRDKSASARPPPEPPACSDCGQ